MTLGKVFGILIFSSLVATGATLAGDISKNLAKSKNLANSKQVANVKGDKVPPKGAAASVVVYHVGPEAPIVMGRSVSWHHKTKLHHVRFERKFNFRGRFAINLVKNEVNTEIKVMRISSTGAIEAAKNHFQAAISRARGRELWDKTGLSRSPGRPSKFITAS
jgi:hypothetical protein